MLKSFPLLWPLIMYAAIVAAIAAFMLGASYVLGERHWERWTATPYESGNLPTSGARPRIFVNFYLIAMFFVIFDIGAAFIFAWSVSLRAAGWSGLVVMTIFISVLLAALVYLVRLGVFDIRNKSRSDNLSQTGGTESSQLIERKVTT